MPAQPKLIASTLVSACVSAALGLGVAILYLIILRKVTGVGRGMDGLALAASLVVFPVAAAIFALVWTGVSLRRRGKGAPPSVRGALLAGGAIGLLAGLVFAGPNGFKLHGGAPAFNYAMTVLGAVGAATFELVAKRMMRAG
ncbi:MAG: hypothetical protein R2724_29975 [Bryobacterales bacterium]